MLSLPAHILAKIAPEPTTGCWLWCDAGHEGYGRMMIRGIRYPAHRLVYTLLRGPVPEGLELDHLCRQTACVNPDHLEPVTHLVNMRRSPVLRARVPPEPVLKTFCVRGHPFVEGNLNVRRHSLTGHLIRRCQACARMRTRQYRARLAAVQETEAT